VRLLHLNKDYLLIYQRSHARVDAVHALKIEETKKIQDFIILM